MNKNDLPFQLDQGLALERPIVLLRWDISIDVLAREGRPANNHSNPGPGAFLVWKDSSIFNGLKCDILYRSDLPNAFRIHLHDTSHSERMSQIANQFAVASKKDPKTAAELVAKGLEQERENAVNIVRESYQHYSAELTARFGVPKRFEGKKHRPRARWHFGPVCISLWIGESDYPNPFFLGFSVFKPGIMAESLDVPRSIDPQFCKAQHAYQDWTKSEGQFNYECWSAVFLGVTLEQMREWDLVCKQIYDYSWDLAELVRDNMIDENNAMRMLAAHYPMLTEERIAAIYKQAMFETMW